ncbi:MAG: LppU/SCO3897 family protein [Stackebrandtia sp.]
MGSNVRVGDWDDNHYCLEQALTYQPPGDPNQPNPYQPGQYPPPQPGPAAPGQSGWPDPYAPADPYGQPPTSGPAYGQPTSGQPYGQPTSGQPFGQPGPGGPGGPGMPPPPPGGFVPGSPPPPSGGNNGAMIGIVIGVVVLVLLAVGIGGFFLIRSAGSDDSADDPTDSPTSSESSSSEAPSDDTTTDGGSGISADSAITGDCLDRPSDPNDTVVVDCGDSEAYYEVTARVDDPTTTENTSDAASGECKSEGADFDTTLYILGADVAAPFVLCLSTI